MTEYVIYFNYGYGREFQIVKADTEEGADQMAYEEWRDGAEANADYGVKGEATDELKKEYDL